MATDRQHRQIEQTPAEAHQPARDVSGAGVRAHAEASPATALRRAREDLPRLTAADVLALQRTAGNRAVCSLLGTERPPRPRRKAPGSHGVAPRTAGEEQAAEQPMPAVTPSVPAIQREGAAATAAQPGAPQPDHAPLFALMADLQSQLGDRVAAMFAERVYGQWYLIYGRVEWTEPGHRSVRWGEEFQGPPIKKKARVMICAFDLEHLTALSPGEYWSRMGVVESEGLGPLEYIGGALFVKGLVKAALKRILARRAARRAGGLLGEGGPGPGKAPSLPAAPTLPKPGARPVHVPKEAGARLRTPKGSSGSGAGSGAGTGTKPGAFYKPKVRADPSMPAGQGATNKFGDIRYSTRGKPSDMKLALYHEKVHSALSPKLKFFRTLRANIGMAAYDKSAFLKYLEEALAESYAQLRVHGIKGLPTGLTFPIKNGYVTLRAVVTEAAIGTIVVGGTTYGVYLAARSRLHK